MFIAVSICICLSGCTTLKINKHSFMNCEDTSGWEGMVKVNKQLKHSGDGCFELYGKYRTELLYSKLIPVDVNEEYNLSAWMRTLDERYPASAYLGLYMYDKNKKVINIHNVGIHPDTETTLAKDVHKGSKELHVIKNPKWTKVPYKAVAFNVESQYQDLPNYNISPQIENIIDDGEQYKVVLKTPMNEAYPAGTKVRLHFPWGMPFLYGASGWMPAEWKEFSISLKGEAQSGNVRDQFWRGTKYVRVFIWFGNWNRKPESEARLLVDDINFSLE